MNEKIDFIFGKQKTLTAGAVITYIIATMLLLLALPFIAFGLSWLVGLIIRVTFGDLFVKGLALLNINIDKSQIPLFCGVIGTIATFFRSAINYKKGE